VFRRREEHRSRHQHLDAQAHLVADGPQQGIQAPDAPGGAYRVWAARHRELRGKPAIRSRRLILSHRGGDAPLETAQRQPAPNVPDTIVSLHAFALEADYRMTDGIEEAQTPQVQITERNSGSHRRTVDLD
jgi:hypothetical protein